METQRLEMSVKTMTPQGIGESAEDVLHIVPRAITKLHSVWLKSTYPFAAMGRGVSVHYSCDIKRSTAHSISIGEQTVLAESVWLNVVGEATSNPKIMLGRACQIGRRATISSRNRIVLEDDVLLAPSVLIMDHNHEYGDPDRPIHAQGVTAGGTIRIEKNCWLGHGAVIVCNHGELLVGRNSVIGANAVVTRSVPPFSVVGGSPAKVLKTFDRLTGKWLRINE